MAAGYSNPFSLGRPAAGVTQNPVFDLEAFDLSSHEDSSDGFMMSVDYAERLFKSDMRSKGVERYSGMSAQRSEGELGRSDSLGDISLGEIRVPGATKIRYGGRQPSSKIPT